MTPATPLRRGPLAHVVATFRREFAAVAVLGMVANLLMLTPTLYMLQLFDRVMISRNELTLLMVSLIVLLLLAFMQLAEWFRARLMIRVGVRLDEALGDRAFRAGFRSELEKSGHDPVQAQGDLANVRQYLTGAGFIAILDAPWSPIYIGVMFLLHPVLGWLSVVFVAVLVLLGVLSRRVSMRPQAASAAADVELHRYLFGKLRNAEVVEAMGMLGSLRRLWAFRYRRSAILQARAQDLGYRMTALVKFARYTQQALALGAGALLAIRGEISLGSMIAATVMMGRASAPVEGIVATWGPLLSARAAFDRLRRLLDAHPEQDAGRRVEPPTGALRVENLVAMAPGRAEPVLKCIDVEFAAGSVVAILGPSGAGKSTLARALLGIWPYIEGRVLLDGEPLGRWDRRALGGAIGYLPQDIELFDGTIAENIARFGTVDPEQVIDAARRVGMHEAILRYPQGYDTVLGEGGTTLSGGQRQRIATARALYGNPRLVVLDEPSANLDDAGEIALVATIEDLKARGTTTFLITHRPGAVALVDRVIVLKEGAIDFDGKRQQGAPAPGAAPPNPEPTPTPPGDILDPQPA